MRITGEPLENRRRTAERSPQENEDNQDDESYGTLASKKEAPTKDHLKRTYSIEMPRELAMTLSSTKFT
jgi:hypothetical protein